MIALLNFDVPTVFKNVRNLNITKLNSFNLARKYRFSAFLYLILYTKSFQKNLFGVFQANYFTVLATATKKAPRLSNFVLHLTGGVSFILPHP